MARKVRVRKAKVRKIKDTQENKSPTPGKHHYGSAIILVVVIIAALALIDMYTKPPPSSSYTPPAQQPQAPQQPTAPTLPPTPPATQQTVNFAIDSVTTSSSSVSIRNAGSQTIMTSDVHVYVGGELRSCTWISDVTTIPPSTLRQCIFSGARCVGGQQVTVTILGTSKSFKC